MRGAIMFTSFPNHLFHAELTRNQPPMMTLRRIDPLSLAKVGGLLYALIGLLIGALISLFAVAGAMSIAQDASDEFVGLVFGVGAIFVLPVFYGAMGFVGGLLSAFLYNLAAKFVGGVVLDLEPRITS